MLITLICSLGLNLYLILKRPVKHIKVYPHPQIGAAIMAHTFKTRKSRKEN